MTGWIGLVITFIDGRVWAEKVGLIIGSLQVNLDCQSIGRWLDPTGQCAALVHIV